MKEKVIVFCPKKDKVIEVRDEVCTEKKRLGCDETYPQCTQKTGAKSKRMKIW